MTTAKKTTSPSAGGGGTPTGCVTEPCPLHTCPTVEIEINNTPEAKDDVVALKCTHPAGRANVNCRIKATGSPTVDAAIVLTNPDGRLRFPNAHDKTHTLTVPKTGAWVPFSISGEKGSDAIGDAVIEAHCHTATGDLKGSKPVTVFWFDQAQITLTPEGSYSFTAGDAVYSASGGAAIKHSAQARIRPDGIDCTVPQITNLRIGIMQNTPAQVSRSMTWNNPTIIWNATVAAGTIVNAAQEMSRKIRRPIRSNDSSADVSPLYDQPGKHGPLGTIDPNSLQPPMGCAGGAAATSNDSPQSPIPPALIVPAKTADGHTVGQLSYAFKSLSITPSFTAWVVVFDTVSQKLCALRQRGWSLHVNTAGPANQQAVPDGAETKPTTPVLTPFANDLVQDPANRVTGPADSHTFTFRAPQTTPSH